MSWIGSDLSGVWPYKIADSVASYWQQADGKVQPIYGFESAARFGSTVESPFNARKIIFQVAGPWKCHSLYYPFMQSPHHFNLL